MSLSRALLLLALFACVFVASVRAEEEEPVAQQDNTAGSAFLLARKSLSASEVIVGEEIKVTVSITNAGLSPAFNVKANDDIWAAEVLNGARTATYDKIMPRETVSFSYTVRMPATPTNVPCAEAKVTFLPEAGAEERRVTVLSTRVNEEIEMPHEKNVGHINVMTAADYERKHTRHIKEWCMFVVLLAIPLGMPLFLYNVRSNELAALEKKN